MTEVAAGSRRFKFWRIALAASLTATALGEFYLGGIGSGRPLESSDLPPDVRMVEGTATNIDFSINDACGGCTEPLLLGLLVQVRMPSGKYRDVYVASEDLQTGSRRSFPKNVKVVRYPQWFGGWNSGRRVWFEYESKTDEFRISRFYHPPVPPFGRIRGMLPGY